MNVTERFAEAVSTIEQLLVDTEGLSLDVRQKLEKVRVLVSDLSVEFSDIHYYNVRVTRKDIPEDLQQIELLLPDVCADMAMAADNKPTYERSNEEKGAKVLVTMEVQMLFADILPRVEKLTPRYVHVVGRSEY